MPDLPETAAGKTAEAAGVPILLVVNLGTPEAPTAKAVRRYLAEFLHDHRVVQLSRWIWCPLLHFLILPLRGPKAAAKYAKVWLPQGSPLAVYTSRLGEAMQQRLPGWRVVHAMRYGEPSLKRMLSALDRRGSGRVIVLPLYPQYSTTTTASIADVVAAQGQGLGASLIDDYSTDPQWVAAVTASIRSWRERHGHGEHLLFSFHGLPQRIADGGDPYPQRCQASVQAITASLGLDLADHPGERQRKGDRPDARDCSRHRAHRDPGLWHVVPRRACRALHA
jgi:ferrochelatase